ncbi:MAG: aminotransferase class IV [Deltaproteobacteria bacterium]|nr:aminotransferase class IV [Deltaproteobacteria bacterium]
MSAPTVWLSGRFVSAERARVPALSPAVLDGVGAYETLRLVRGEAPLAALHAARLATTCLALGLEPPRTDWARVIVQLARRNGVARGVARITLSRDFELVSLRTLPRGLARERREGIGLETVRLQRGAAALKSTSRLPLVLAEGTDGSEVLLRGERGALLETSRANFFAVTARGLETAPSPLVLPGIARGLVVELARGLGAPIRLRAPRAGELEGVREAFVTNAVRGVRPVHSIDGVRIPVAPDSLTFRLQKSLDQRMGL